MAGESLVPVLTLAGMAAVVAPRPTHARTSLPASLLAPQALLHRPRAKSAERLVANACVSQWLPSSSWPPCARALGLMNVAPLGGKPQTSPQQAV